MGGVSHFKAKQTHICTLNQGLQKVAMKLERHYGRKYISNRLKYVTREGLSEEWDGVAVEKTAPARVVVQGRDGCSRETAG